MFWWSQYLRMKIQLRNIFYFKRFFGYFWHGRKVHQALYCPQNCVIESQRAAAYGRCLSNQKYTAAIINQRAGNFL